MILCGEKSVDGDTAQVGAETAELLGIPHAYYVDAIEVCGMEKSEWKSRISAATDRSES